MSTLSQLSSFGWQDDVNPGIGCPHDAEVAWGKGGQGFMLQEALLSLEGVVHIFVDLHHKQGHLQKGLR